MRTQAFHIGNVLSIATERLVSPDNMSGVAMILGFMCRETPFAHQIPRFVRECRPHLLLQYPQFAEPTIKPALDDLDRLLANSEVKSYCEEVVHEWLLKILSGDYDLGELPLCGDAKDMLKVKRIPFHDHARIDPESEAAEKFPPDRIIKL